MFTKLDNMGSIVLNLYGSVLFNVIVGGLSRACETFGNILSLVLYVSTNRRSKACYNE
jgi:hypothetical protein